MNLILLALLVAVGINLVLFVPAFAFKTDKLTDFSYSLSFTVVAVAGYLLSDRTSIHLLALLMVLMWSLRLGSFLVLRIYRQGRDGRFDEMREHFGAFLQFWLAQGLSVFVVLLSALFLWQQSDTQLTGGSGAGVAIFAIGLFIEATADLQKLAFNTPKRSSVWIDSGIWRMSRHPNYLGEIMVWVGMYIFAFSNLSPTLRVVALLSPLFIAGLLLFVSGMPILEKAADKRWGDKKAYQQYKKEVPALLPTPRSIARIFG
jgi:steroid 5-alpha reductase family enzyme